MGEFEIECSKISSLAEKISGCGREIQKQESRAADILRQIRFHKTDYRGLETALSGITDSLHIQQEQITQYGRMLGQIAGAYKNTQTGILQTGASGTHLQDN